MLINVCLISHMENDFFKVNHETTYSSSSIWFTKSLLPLRITLSWLKSWKNYVNKV